jgi:hypothetical protein
MSKTQLTFKIVGKGDGFVEFDDFVDFCDAIQRSLRVSEQAVAGRLGAVHYRVVDLECSSAVIRLEPHSRRDSEIGRKTISHFRETIAGIQEGRVDPRLGIDVLETFRNLANPLKKHAARIVIGRTTLTPNYTKTIDQLLDQVTSYEGSISGRLDRINVHNDKNEFVVYPPIANRQVPCLFHESLLPDIRRALKRNVTVFGTIFYRPGGALPSRVHARTIDLHPKDDELPDLHAVRDLGPWDTGNLSAVEFVRALRDE